MILQVIFWASLALIVYGYFGFSLLLCAQPAVRQAVQSADCTPHVTLLTWPTTRPRSSAAVWITCWQWIIRATATVLVASDGSDDGTNEIVAQYAQHGIRLLAFPRGGKINTINAAVKFAEGEIIAFSDANSMCTPDALRQLVRPFADPQVGGVAGYQLYTSSRDSNAAGFGERAYSDVDQKWKQWQSAAGSVTQATGALYAIRRELFEPVPAEVGDDIVISFRVIEKGYRFVYEPRALAMETVSHSSQSEFRRKVRLCVFGWASILACRGLLNPMRYGFYSLQLFSHKILRYLMPWPLMALFITSGLLYRTSPFFAALFLLQAVFYAMALVVACVPDATLRRLALPKPLTLPFFFCMAYAGSLRAQWITLLGRRWDHWTPRGAQGSGLAQSDAHSAPKKVAYIMSRFPKITETFVMYEIVEHEKRGMRVEIYPLMRERQKVSHPDAARLVAGAHFLSFVSPAILSANLHYLRHKPKAYFGVIKEALSGTFGSQNFFLGALLFLPKSVAFARDMERTGVSHVHAHFATHAALSAFIVHRLTGIPFSFTAHAHDVQCDRRMLREKLEAASFAVAISECNRQIMVEECGEHLRQKIHVIHCGADTELFQPAPGGLPDGPLRMVCIASLNRMKGHQYLIEACRILRERGIGFHCDLIGEGWLYDKLAEQIKSAGLEDAIILHGAQPRATVQRMVHEANVKVLACVQAPNGQRDGIPVAIMEAMACGLPVVSTVISGIPELVKDGVSGFLVQPCDSVGLANALEHLAADPQLRGRMGPPDASGYCRNSALPPTPEHWGHCSSAPLRQRTRRIATSPHRRSRFEHALTGAGRKTFAPKKQARL